MSAISLVYDDSSQNAHKFWRAHVDGCDLHLAWGRIGTAGQSKVKSFSSAAAAEAEFAKAAGEKVNKGYVREGAPQPARPATSAPVQPGPVGMGAEDLVAEVAAALRAGDVDAEQFADFAARYTALRAQTAQASTELEILEAQIAQIARGR